MNANVVHARQSREIVKDSAHRCPLSISLSLSLQHQQGEENVDGKVKNKNKKEFREGGGCVSVESINESWVKR